MKIIDAYWEKRNFGLKVAELIFDQGEEVDHAVIRQLERSNDYIVAKIPGDSIFLMHELEKKGYRFLEVQQVIYFLVSQLRTLDPLWIKRFDDYECIMITERSILDQICNKISKGLYLSGRISVDPVLDNRISDIRIINWLHDLYNKNETIIYSLMKKNIPVGYFVLEKLGKVHFNILQAGIFKEYQNKGLSYLILYNSLKVAENKKVKGIYASISTNNRKTLNSISRFVNFSVKETYIVARKLTSNGKE